MAFQAIHAHSSGSAVSCNALLFQEIDILAFPENWRRGREIARNLHTDAPTPSPSSIYPDVSRCIRMLRRSDVFTPYAIIPSRGTRRVTGIHKRGRGGQQ